MSGSTLKPRASDDSMVESYGFWPVSADDVEAGQETAAGVSAARPAAPKALRPPAVNPEDVAGLGRVVCVSGSQVVVNLERRALTADRTPALRKGALVKLFGARCATYGIITGLSIPVPTAGAGDAIGGGDIELAEIDLIGEIPLNGESLEEPFRRGVSLHPSLGDVVYATNAKDLEKVYASGLKNRVNIGVMHENAARPAYVDADALLANHFALLGATGSGKSCALTVILGQVLEQEAKTHILLIDPHNEYSRAFGDKAEMIRPNDLQIPFWFLNSDEIAEVILGNKRKSDLGEEACGILYEAITQARRSHYRSQNPRIADNDAFITIDTPVPYSVRDIIRLIDEQTGRLERKENLAPYRWLKSRLEILRADARYDFMFGGYTIRDNMADILSRLFRLPMDGKPLSIVDLSGVPSDVLNVVISVLSRMAFDFGLWSRGAQPLLLVCEEAHRYAPATADMAFEPTRQALARIAKEGRKYGVSLCVISQRPAEIAPTILSQCNTTFAFRTNNLKDQEILRGIMADSAHGLLDFLPSMGNREAVAVGVGVAVSMRLRFDKLPPAAQPHSGTSQASPDWNGKPLDRDFVSQVVDRWRRQRR